MIQTQASQPLPKIITTTDDQPSKDKDSTTPGFNAKTIAGLNCFIGSAAIILGMLF